jgi:hypothetical protein
LGALLAEETCGPTPAEADPLSSFARAYRGFGGPTEAASVAPEDAAHREGGVGPSAAIVARAPGPPRGLGFWAGASEASC